MSQKKYRKPKAARNRTRKTKSSVSEANIAKKRAQQLKQAQERKQRTRYSRRRQLIDVAKRRKKAVKYYQSLKHAGYTERQAAQQTAEKFQTGLSSIRRWEKLNRERGFRALMDESRRPHTIHFQISLEVKLLVVVIRTLLGWGESRISVELERREIATISHTSVNRIFHQRVLKNFANKNIGHYMAGGYQHLLKNSYPSGLIMLQRVGQVKVKSQS